MNFQSSDGERRSVYFSVNDLAWGNIYATDTNFNESTKPGL